MKFAVGLCLFSLVQAQGLGATYDPEGADGEFLDDKDWFENLDPEDRMTTEEEIEMTESEKQNSDF